jgi:hypothetical protein
MASDWQRVNNGGIRVTHLVSGSYGLPLVGGSRGGRGVVLFSRPDGGALGVVLEGGPLLALTAGSSALAVTADGAVHYVDEPAAWGRATVQTERLPLAPSGASPVMAWATTGDWETRLVLAYPAPVGFELWVLGVGLGNELTPMDTTLVATDLDRVRVTSHEGVVVLAGPVADDVREATGCRVWLCPDPDFGEQGDWEELTLDPAPDTVTDAQDASVWWWLGGSCEGAAVVWGEERNTVETPRVTLDPEHPVTCIARTPVGERTVAIAVQTPDGPSLHWQDGEGWREARLPEGRLLRALWTPAHREVPERVHAVVDGVHWSIDTALLG